MKEERFPHTRKPLRRQRLLVAEGGSFGATEESAGQSGEIPAHRIDADRGGRGLGAEAPASVGSQGEDWGWRREHSLKGASAPQLAGRESGKKSGAAEEARDFFLPLCFLVREERGLRVPLKGTAETGTSRGYQRGPQRRA